MKEETIYKKFVGLANKYMSNMGNNEGQVALSRGLSARADQVGRLNIKRPS